VLDCVTKCFWPALIAGPSARHIKNNRDFNGKKMLQWKAVWLTESFFTIYGK